MAGSAAALVAALVFRRNLGGAEVPQFLGIAPPADVAGWFTLLHGNPLLGLTLLNVFDIINYALVGVMFATLYVALKDTDKFAMVAATGLGVTGVLAYFASNNALPLYFLSSQYAQATETQKTILLSEGEVLLGNGFSPVTHYPGAALYLSLLLVSAAGLIAAAVMWGSKSFGKLVAAVGVTASLLDLAYCAAVFAVPVESVVLLTTTCMASGGFFVCVWHLLVGYKLFKLTRKPVEVIKRE